MQFDEQKDQVTIERTLKVVFLDPERPSPVSVRDAIFVLFLCIVNGQSQPKYFEWLKALDKLKRQLAQAEAATEADKKPPIDTGPKVVGEGLIVDEWVSVSAVFINTWIIASPDLLHSSNNVFPLTMLYRRSGGRGILLGNRLRPWIQ